MTSKVADNICSARPEPNLRNTVAVFFLTIVAAAGLTLSSSTAFAQSIPGITVSAIGTVQQNPTIKGRDGAWSAQINNRSMWTFSDTTLTSPNNEGQTLISNSRSWQVDTGNGAEPIGNLTCSPVSDCNIVDQDNDMMESFLFSTDQQTFNSQNNANITGCTQGTFPCGYSYAIWSAPIIPAPASSPYEAYFFYKLLMRDGYENVKDEIGVGIATLKNNNLTMQTLSSGTAYPQLMWQQSSTPPTSDPTSYTAYYCGALTVGDTLYMMSCDRPVAGTNTHAYYLAKVPLEDILTLGDWTYWNGTAAGWQSTPAYNSDSLLFEGSPNGSTIIYNSVLNEYITAYTDTTYSSTNPNTLVFRVASKPEGPWSPEQFLYTGATPICPDNSDTNDYDVEPHQEFEVNDGTTSSTEYFTYIQANGNNGNPNNCPTNSNGGRNIQILQVTFTPGS